MASPRRRLGLALCLSLVPILTIACGGAPAPSPPADPHQVEWPYLVEPTVGFTAALDGGTRAILDQGYRTLRQGDLAGARARVRPLLDRDPELAPGLLLLAQRALLEGDFAGSRDAVSGILERHPEYTAALLVSGRVAEKLGDVTAAYASFRAAADRSAVARERERDLRDRATEIVGARVRDALSRLRGEEAQAELATLRDWAPEALDTLELSFDVATFLEDSTAQLLAARSLAEREPLDPSWQERRGELELVAGEPAAALEIFTALHAQYPGEMAYEDKLDRAKFLWRLRNLPEIVQLVAGRPELTRAEYALLIYWLVPEVRARGGGSPKIATDVLDHPHRQQIVRVVNLELMDLEGSVRRFRPDAPIVRSEGLSTLLRLLDREGERAACLGSAGGRVQAWESICASAARCGLLPDVGECLPAATLSGNEATDWIRRLASY